MKKKGKKKEAVSCHKGNEESEYIQHWLTQGSAV